MHPYVRNINIVIKKTKKNREKRGKKRYSVPKTIQIERKRQWEGSGRLTKKEEKCARAKTPVYSRARERKTDPESFPLADEFRVLPFVTPFTRQSR